jgi:hypothetical protein
MAKHVVGAAVDIPQDALRSLDDDQPPRPRGVPMRLRRRWGAGRNATDRAGRRCGSNAAS